MAIVKGRKTFKRMGNIWYDKSFIPREIWEYGDTLL